MSPSNNSKMTHLGTSPRPTCQTAFYPDQPFLIKIPHLGVSRPAPPLPGPGRCGPGMCRQWPAEEPFAGVCPNHPNHSASCVSESMHCLHLVLVLCVCASLSRSLLPSADYVIIGVHKEETQNTHTALPKGHSCSFA